MESKWWQDRVVYQIYPRSFADSNDDGVGDLKGIISKLDYLKKLGIGIIWLSPPYVSPNEDNGYDIADYCNIQSEYGTLDDMDKLIEQAHRRDIKVLLDLVINHTSRAHQWFQNSRRRIDPYTNFYYWADKPSNWTGFFGEKAWEYDEVRGQYYLHLFAKGQPDLNYHEPKVIDAVEGVMRFWLDKGADGFRCDVINILWKTDLEDGKKKIALTGSEKYISAPGLHPLLQRFNSEVLSKYDCYTVGETVFADPQMARDLTSPERHELNTVFSFEHMETDCFFVKWLLRPFSPRRFFRALAKWQESLDWNTVYLENHDQPRSPSRFADGSPSSAKALAVLLLCLRGTAFIFEGQEIGMTNFDYKSMEDIKDIESHNIYDLATRLHLPRRIRWKMIRTKSRDNARTPMQWSDEANGGFSKASPWLKSNSNYKSINVKAQENDPDSVLAFYRRLLEFRNQSEILKKGAFSQILNQKGVFAFERSLDGKRLVIVINLSGKRRQVSLKETEVVMSSSGASSFSGSLEGYEAFILK
ncbi:MAG: alpha-glucosidase [Sphaerochaetaceae bacterium]|nr:alpha-glucosidase [Sphaerochaetaceae bacterium]